MINLEEVHVFGDDFMELCNSAANARQDTESKTDYPWISCLRFFLDSLGFRSNPCVDLSCQVGCCEVIEASRDTVTEKLDNLTDNLTALKSLEGRGHGENAAARRGLPLLCKGRSCNDGAGPRILRLIVQISHGCALVSLFFDQPCK